MDFKNVLEESVNSALRVQRFKSLAEYYEDVYSDVLEESIESEMGKVGPQDITYNGRGATFKVKKRDNTYAKFDVTLGGGSLIFSDEYGGYNVTKQFEYVDRRGKKTVDMRAANKMFARVITAALKIALDYDLKNIDFSSSDPGRTKVYRRLSRIFGKHFIVKESGRLKRDAIFDRKGNPIYDKPRSARPIAPVTIEKGRNITLISTREKNTYRIFTDNPSSISRQRSDIKYGEINKSDAKNILKDRRERETSYFHLSEIPKEQDEEIVFTPITDINSLPDDALVLAYKHKDDMVAKVYYVRGDPRPGDTSKKMSPSQRKAFLADAARVFKKTTSGKNVREALETLGLLTPETRRAVKELAKTGDMVKFKRLIVDLASGYNDPQDVLDNPALKKALSHHQYEIIWAKYGLKNKILAGLIRTRLGDKPPNLKEVTYKEITDILKVLGRTKKDRTSE